MFFSLRKKPVLKELIPTGYIDIHSHVLPGIDDGADTVSTSATLLQSMQDLGMQQIIATPHTLPNVWENTSETILESYTHLQKEAAAITKGVQLRASSEYFLDAHFMETTLAQDDILPLKGKKVLVELSYMNPPINLKEILFAIQVKGYDPVLAHPERYLYYHNDFDKYEELKNAGCSFQLNLLSTVGHYGGPVAAVADELLKSGLIDYTGSDIHHKHHIKSFDKKLVIKSIKPLKKAMEANQVFGV